MPPGAGRNGLDRYGHNDAMAMGVSTRWNRASRNLRLGFIGLLLVLVGGTIGYVAFGYGLLNAVSRR